MYQHSEQVATSAAQRHPFMVRRGCGEEGHFFDGLCHEANCMGPVDGDDGVVPAASKITKASLLAGVGFPLGMYWGQSSGRGSDLSLRRFLAEVNHSPESPPLGGFKPSLVHVF